MINLEPRASYEVIFEKCGFYSDIPASDIEYLIDKYGDVIISLRRLKKICVEEEED